jgi:hypothetical protein
MRGKHVERRFGWDTHGLPAELEAMSQLGIKTKDEILEIGIETFNAKCRESVMTYTKEWQDYVTRQARWVDFDNDYKTLNPTFMESVLWAFKTLYDKGLVYEGFRSCPTAGTTRRRCPTTSCGWTTTSTRCGRTRPSPSATASRPASWPSSGRRPRGPCRATSRWPCAPTSTTSSSSPRCPTGSTERYVLAEARLLPTPASSVRMPRSAHRRAAHRG